MRKLRRLFLRVELDTHEVRLLRGILADAQRMARLVTERCPPHAQAAPGRLSEPPKIG
jgi:tRNA (cytidine32/uridine32-2'-O)-methyltransferase